MSNLSYVHLPMKKPNEVTFFHQFLDATVEKMADVEALITYDMEKRRRSITFKDIRDRSMWFAQSLLTLGLSRGDAVMLIGPSSIEFVISTFALSRIGVNIILVAPGGLTKDKVDVLTNTLEIKGFIFDPFMQGSQLTQLNKGLEQMNSNKPVEFIITMRDKQLSTHVYCKEDLQVFETLIELGRRTEVAELIKVQANCQPDDPCYAYFTSGSTGTPKFVQFVTGNVSTSMITMRTMFSIQELGLQNGTYHKMYCDRPMAWVFGIHSILRICTGASYVWAPTAVALQASEDAFEIMAIEKVNCAIIGVSTIQTMKKQNLHLKYDLSSLQCVIISGQRYPLPLLDVIFQCLPFVSVILGYGSAEATFSTMAMYNKNNLSSDDFGKLDVIQGVEAKIIDDDWVILPRCTSGEICIRSPYMFLEYVGNVAATREAVSATGWFRMGDVGKMDDKGRIEVLGRKQEIIKRATVKIFPAEIESVLMQHRNVASAMVFGVPDETYEDICACVILTEGQYDAKTRLTDLEAWCAEQWPPGGDGLSLKPKYFIPMEKFPMGKTGKTDSIAMRKIAIDVLGLKEV